jgi:hypothetical protein
MKNERLVRDLLFAILAVACGAVALLGPEGKDDLSPGDLAAAVDRVEANLDRSEKEAIETRFERIRKEIGRIEAKIQALENRARSAAGGEAASGPSPDAARRPVRDRARESISRRITGAREAGLRAALARIGTDAGLDANDLQAILELYDAERSQIRGLMQKVKYGGGSGSELDAELRSIRERRNSGIRMRIGTGKYEKIESLLPEPSSLAAIAGGDSRSGGNR